MTIFATLKRSTNKERSNDDMTKNTKTPTTDAAASKTLTMPATLKTVVTLVEVVARFLAAYPLLNNFDHIVAVAAGWYFLITAAMAFVALVHKASKN
jgi:hypothetical protein